MTMKFVDVIDDNNYAKEIPLTEWAELCSIFFLAYEVYPPFTFAKKFVDGELLNAGMSGYLEWKRFDFDKKDYCKIFKFFIKKNPSLKLYSGDIVYELKTFADLSVWRQEIAYGIPFYEHKRLFDECLSLERKFRDLLEKDDGNAYKVYADIMNAQAQLNDYCAGYIGKKNNE